jgi:hypothetical protein
VAEAEAAPAEAEAEAAPPAREPYAADTALFWSGGDGESKKVFVVKDEGDDTLTVLIEGTNTTLKVNFADVKTQRSRKRSAEEAAAAPEAAAKKAKKDEGGDDSDSSSDSDSSDSDDSDDEDEK